MIACVLSNLLHGFDIFIQQLKYIIYFNIFFSFTNISALSLSVWPQIRELIYWGCMISNRRNHVNLIKL